MISRISSLLFFLVSFVFSLSSQAAPELRATAIRNYELFEGPSEESGRNDETIKTGEDLWILGSSVGGLWFRVAKRSGGTGWIPKTELTLERVPPDEIYEMNLRLEQESRYRTWVNLEGGLSSGSLPFGKGALLSFTVNLSPSGVLGVNEDQVEFGGLVSYYLGKEVFGYIENDDTKYKLNQSSDTKFLTYGLYGQWLFRGGSRGSFMIGPRIGILLSDFNLYDSYRAPLLAGLVMRFFNHEHWGWNASAQMAFETSTYFLYSIGLSLRI